MGKSPLRWLALSAVLAAPACVRLRDTPREWPCQSSSDCDSGEVCLDDVCRPAGYCPNDSGCGPRQACRDERCVSVECTLQDQSACSPYACNPNTYTCQTGCSGSCASGFACVGGKCVTPQCTPGFAPDQCAGYLCQSGACATTCDGLGCANEFVCKNNRCVEAPKILNAPCGTDVGCFSGHCCPTARRDERLCQTSCVPLPNGSGCEWNEACASGKCVNQRCRSCTTEAECLVEVCTGRCGVVDGLDCGACPAGHLCNAAQQCENVCAGKNCGLVQGVSCGTCSAEEFCNSSNVCGSRCPGIECGIYQGFDCGTCAGRTYCAGGHCSLACEGKNCGTDNGVDCGKCDVGEVCTDYGACVLAVCDPAQLYFCKDGSVYQCYGGWSSMLRVTCSGTEYCTPGLDHCSPQVCSPGKSACVENELGTCNSEGSALVSGAVDCAGTDCTEIGCGAASTDSVAPTLAETSGQDGAVGNVYSVTKETTLVDFSQTYGFSTLAPMTYFVYQATTKNGPYGPLVTRDGVVDPNKTVQSSPLLNVKLEPGKFYIVGVSPTISSLEGHGYHAGSITTAAVSFGNVVDYYEELAVLPATISGPFRHVAQGLFTQELHTVVLR